MFCDEAGRGVYSIGVVDLGVYAMRRILWPLGAVESLADFDSVVCRSTSKVVSSANFAERMLVPGGKVRVAMAWLCRSRGREVMLDACIRRWMWSVAGDVGEVRAM